jgi:two-component system, LuxR family, sensor kinase FixL
MTEQQWRAPGGAGADAPADPLRALREAEERYRLAARATDDVIWDYDIDAGTVRWNEAFGRRFGHRLPDMVTPIVWWEAQIHPDDLARVTRSIGAAIAGRGDSWSEEYRLRRADDGYADVLDRGYLIRDAGGRAFRMVGAILDLSDRKAAELRLRESEARFRHMADHAPVMVWMTEADDNTSYLSQSWYAFTGQTPATGLGRAWIAALHPDDAKPIGRLFAAKAAAHEAFEIEFRVRRHDGEWRWVLNSARPRFDDDGAFLGYVGSLIDISERKATEEALRASEERLRLAQEAAGLGSFEWDTATGEGRASELAFRIFGLPCTDRFGRYERAGLIHSDDRRAVDAHLAAAAAGEREGTIELRVIRPSDGELRWLCITGRTLPDSVPPNYRRVGVVEDITERKLSEARLRESEENYRFTVELSPQLPWTADADGSNVELKRELPGFGGVPGPQATGDWTDERTHPDDLAYRRREWAHSLRSGRPYDAQFRIRRDDGEYRWVRSRGYPRRDADGRIVKWYGVTEDVTAQRTAEQQLQRLQAELSQVARISAMGTLAATLAHELNQPLTAVANYMAGSKRLLEKHGAGAEAVIGEALDAASKAAVQAGEIVRRLRDLVSRGEVKKVPVELAGLVQEACELTFGDGRGRSIELSLEFGPQTRHVLADRIQLQQVLVNLLRNAAEAMSESATKLINLSAMPSGDDGVTVRIEDSGPGVSAEVKRHLFSPFVTTKATGMGVGLSICRSIIEAHGGQLWVEDAASGGAAFCFTLQRAPD